MTNEELLDIYDSIAEEIDDEILDEADELFNISETNMNIPDEYFIWCAKTHLEKAS